MSDGDLALLLGPVDGMMSLGREAAVQFNTRMVTLVREIITLRLDPVWKSTRKRTLKSSGSVEWRDHWFNYKSKRSAAGFRAPIGWLGRYETLYNSGADIALSAILQNAFLGNPTAGEVGPWRN